MCRIAVSIIFSILIFVTASPAQTAPPVREMQSWNDIQLTVPLVKAKDKKSDKVNLVFQGTLRFGDNLKRFSDERIGFGLEFKVKPFLSFLPSYLYRAAQPYGTKKEMEHRIRFEATLEKKFPKASLKSRSRIEYRVRGSMPDSTRFRNRFTLSVPVKQGKKELFAPFVADEPFYDFSKKTWTRNEFSAGISKKISSTLTVDVYYLYQRNKTTILKEIHAIGTAFKFRIP